MYAVIFRSTIRTLDADYQRIAKRMRELAFNEYRCVDFVATFEGDKEVAVSYWHSLEDIQAWRQNPEHQQAMDLAKTRWYSDYQVDVVEVKRSYTSS